MWICLDWHFRGNYPTFYYNHVTPSGPVPRIRDLSREFGTCPENSGLIVIVRTALL